MSHTPKIPGINVFDSLSMGGDVKMVGLPTSDPKEEDKLWNDNGGIKVSAGTEAFNISTRDTEENIIATSPTNPEGEVTIAYGTDTQDLYVWNGTVWYKLADDQLFSNTYSLSFDGTNDYVYFGASSPGTAVTVGVKDMAVSLWFYQTTTSTCYLFSDGSSRVQVSSSSLQVRGTGYTDSRITISDGYSINAWNHFVLTRETDGSQATQKVYLNGVEKDSRTYNITANFNIVNFGFYSTVYYQGLLDEISFHSAGLSASDVSAIYNNGAPIDLTGLYNITGWWRMGDNDSGTGTTITDQGSGGNNLTLANSPTFSTTIPS